MAHHIGDFAGQLDLGGDLQRALLSRLATVPRQFHRRGDAAAEPGRRSQDLHSRTRAMREGVRLRRDQPQSRPIRRPLDSPPLTDRHWYPIYEKMVEYDIPAMVHVSTSCNALLPHHRGPLHQRRHDGGDAVHSGRPLQGFPDAALHRPAWRRRGALSLGPLSRPRAGTEEAAAEGPPAQERLLRHLRLSPAGHRPA